MTNSAGHVLLCLGMHRSGTSLVARSLQCLGASLGPRADWKAADNKLGFFEDLDVLALDERILTVFGRTWDDIEPLPASFENHAALRYGLQIDARALLRSRLSAHPLFGLKEPRLAITLRFWRKVFAEVGCKVSIVHVVRHPLAVAASLYKRNHIPKDRALKLWLRYVTEARAGVDPAWPSVTVLYDEMAVLPRCVIQDIGQALGLAPDQDAVEKFADEFVDRSLWHEDNQDDDKLPVEVRVVWQLERAKARGRTEI